MRFLTVILFLCAIAAMAHSQEPPGLRDAIARHHELQDEESRRLTGAHIPKAGPDSYEFNYALVDLDGDHNRDAIVLFKGNEYCGSGGCTLEIYRGVNQGFDFLSGSTLGREPIRILPDRHFGWRTFTVFVRGGGAKKCDALMRFDGRKYPSNPSMSRCATPAQLASSTLLVMTK